MKSVIAFYHWLTTTRYTRFLESEVERLRRENTSLRDDVDALMCQIYPELAKARRAVKSEGKQTLPASFNWQTR